jgi:hypothetical protein
MTGDKIQPLILRDHTMPVWCFDVLTDDQADEDRTSDLFRWRLLVGVLDLPGPTKAVALWLAHHCTAARPWCWPSTTTLARESGYGRKAIEHAITLLEERGLIFVERQRFENDKRRKTNIYAIAWPATRPVAVTEELCGQPGRRGEPCQRPAGWGVVGAVGGPCKHHREAIPAEMSARDASMTASNASSVGTRCRQMPARDDRKGSSSEGSSSEGTNERVALRFAASDAMGNTNGDAERHAVLLALLRDEKERSEGEGLGDWPSEFEDLLEVERARGMAG